MRTGVLGELVNAEVDVAVVDGDDDGVAVGDTAEVDHAAVVDGDDADAVVDEILGLACTCVDETGSAVEGLASAVGNEHMSRIDGWGDYRTD